MNPPFEEFADFIREWARLPRKKPIEPQTEFERDLGITGDDGLDLLLATEKRFNVALSSEEHGYRKTFKLAPNEFLFHPEGAGPDLNTISAQPAPRVRSFNVGELYEAVREALAKKGSESTD